MVKTNVLYQHGTLALLVPGLLKGTLTSGGLLEHGDTGIGTGEGLDGELIILNGVVYQVRGNGEVRVMPKQDTIPFGNIHWADYQSLGNVADLELDQLGKHILKGHSANTFSPLKLRGPLKT